MITSYLTKRPKITRRLTLMNVTDQDSFSQLTLTTIVVNNAYFLSEPLTRITLIRYNIITYPRKSVMELVIPQLKQTLSQVSDATQTTL